MINFTLIAQYLPYLLNGALVSLEIAGLGCLIGVTGGTMLGVLQSGNNTLVRTIITIFTTILRGTPMLIQIAFMYHGLPMLGIRLDPFWAATIAIGINSSAYISQIIRSGIAAISKGQWEAARVLGFTPIQTMRYIILPQAFMIIIPALGNEFITLIKDSSLASTIGVTELYKEASRIKGITFDVITVYVAVAGIYLIMTSIVASLVYLLENRMKINVKH